MLRVCVIPRHLEARLECHLRLASHGGVQSSLEVGAVEGEIGRAIAILGMSAEGRASALAGEAVEQAIADGLNATHSIASSTPR